MARHAAASHVPARAVALRLLSSAGMARPEAILAAGRLADGEIGRGACGRRRALHARKRRANQRTVHRPVVVAIRIIIFFCGGIFRSIRRITRPRVVVRVESSRENG